MFVNILLIYKLLFCRLQTYFNHLYTEFSIFSHYIFARMFTIFRLTNFPSPLPQNFLALPKTNRTSSMTCTSINIQIFLFLSSSSMTSLLPVRYKDKTQLISQRCAVHSLHHFHLSQCSKTSLCLPPILITQTNVNYLKNIKNISGIKVFYNDEM